jgi:hypothetical protein
MTACQKKKRALCESFRLVQPWNNNTSTHRFHRLISIVGNAFMRDSSRPTLIRTLSVVVRADDCLCSLSFFIDTVVLVPFFRFLFDSVYGDDARIALFVIVVCQQKQQEHVWCCWLCLLNIVEVQTTRV